MISAVTESCPHDAIVPGYPALASMGRNRQDTCVSESAPKVETVFILLAPSHSALLSPLRPPAAFLRCLRCSPLTQSEPEPESASERRSEGAKVAELVIRVGEGEGLRERAAESDTNQLPPLLLLLSPLSSPPSPSPDPGLPGPPLAFSRLSLAPGPDPACSPLLSSWADVASGW
eukprot:1870846-Rhodomonas_salina.1